MTFSITCKLLMKSKSIPTAPARRHLLQSLFRLSHELGRDDRQLAILAEGNTSAKISAETFLVKASGCNLERLTKMACGMSLRNFAFHA